MAFCAFVNSTPHIMCCVRPILATCRDILLNPPRLSTHHTCLFCYDCSVQISTVKVALYFSQKVITWWNSLSQCLFSDLLIFHHNFYKYLRCMLWLYSYHCTCMCYISVLYICCMYLALFLVLVLYVVTWCTLAWKNLFAKCKSLNK